jgi:thiaminase
MEALPMREARALLDEIGRQLQPLISRILGHPYLEMLEQGRVAPEALNTLATQQYQIVSNGIRNIALILARFGQLPSARQLNFFLQAEFAVRDAVLVFAKALGLTPAALESAPTVPGALMFSYYETFLCLYGSDADLITAFYFDAQVWIANARRVSQALQTKYGLSKDAVAFFEMYANYQASPDDVLPHLQAALRRGVPGSQVREAARLLLEYELRFWDAMAEVAGGVH